MEFTGARAGARLFVVRDDGVGFDMAFADQLFKTFGRVHRDDEFRESASA